MVSVVHTYHSFHIYHMNKPKQPIKLICKGWDRLTSNNQHTILFYLPQGAILNSTFQPLITPLIT